jgi:hypothetical protein
MFGQVCEHQPSNVVPTMSLADSTYNGNSVIETALIFGAWPLHGVKKNTVYRRSSMNSYQRMVQFIFNFPRTYATFYGKRNHAEATFICSVTVSVTDSDLVQRSLERTRSNAK